MGDALLLLLIATGTALATGLGALPVAALGTQAAAVQPVLAGLAVGVMAIAAVVGLLIPAFEDGGDGTVALAAAAGAAGLAWSRSALGRRPGADDPAAVAHRRSVLVVAVLFLHSIPEGLAIGSAYAAASASLGAFVIAAIAIQNVPEGTATAIPLSAEGAGPARQVGVAVLTSVPQIPGALLAWAAVDHVDGVLPASFAVAGGAMLALVALDTLPGAWREGPRRDVAGGAVAGAAAMLALSAVLGV